MSKGNTFKDHLFLYLIIGALVVINGISLYATHIADKKVRQVVKDAFSFKVEAEAVAKEEKLFQLGHLPDLNAPAVQPVDSATASRIIPISIEKNILPSSSFKVDVIAFFSVNNCFDCIEAEVAKLNELLREKNPQIRLIQAFYVDDDEALIQRQKEILKPLFSISTLENDGTIIPSDSSLVQITPSVFVVRTSDRVILDVSQPIPGDILKRDLFYLKLKQLLAFHSVTG